MVRADEEVPPGKESTDGRSYNDHRSEGGYVQSVSEVEEGASGIGGNSLNIMKDR